MARREWKLRGCVDGGLATPAGESVYFEDVSDKASIFTLLIEYCLKLKVFYLEIFCRDPLGLVFLSKLISEE